MRFVTPGPCYQGLIHDKKKIIALAYEHLDLPHQVHTPKDCFIYLSIAYLAVAAGY